MERKKYVVCNKSWFICRLHPGWKERPEKAAQTLENHLIPFDTIRLIISTFREAGGTESYPNSSKLSYLNLNNPS